MQKALHCHPRSVSRSMLHAGTRLQFLHHFRSNGGLPIEDQGVVLLQVWLQGMPWWWEGCSCPPTAHLPPKGGTDIPLYNTDNDLLFRQEPFFHYLFGRVAATAGPLGLIS